MGPNIPVTGLMERKMGLGNTFKIKGFFILANGKLESYLLKKEGRLDFEPTLF
jgi:hypothetical protein